MKKGNEIHKIDIRNKIKEKIDSKNGRVSFFKLEKLKDIGFENIEKLPYSLRVYFQI